MDNKKNHKVFQNNEINISSYRSVIWTMKTSDNKKIKPSDMKY